MLEQLFKNIRAAKNALNEFRAELPSLKEIADASEEFYVALASEQNKETVRTLFSSSNHEDHKLAMDFILKDIFSDMEDYPMKKNNNQDYINDRLQKKIQANEKLIAPIKKEIDDINKQLIQKNLEKGDKERLEYSLLIKQNAVLEVNLLSNTLITFAQLYENATKMASSKLFFSPEFSEQSKSGLAGLNKSFYLLQGALEETKLTFDELRSEIAVDKTFTDEISKVYGTTFEQWLELTHEQRSEKLSLIKNLKEK